MDETTFKERVKRLKEVNDVIKELDQELRKAAFDLLKGYVTAVGLGSQSATSPEAQDDAPEELFSEFSHEKPADNAKLAAAYHFSQFGSAAFAPDDIRRIAEDAGLTVPERIDMTFTQAKHDGKKLFKKAAKGKFQATIHGEKYFKDTYRVRKGRKAKPESDEQ